MKSKSLLGKTYNRLTAIEEIAEKRGGHTYYRCVCSCGSGKIVEVSKGNLKNGGVKSCGCLNRENGENQIVPMIGQKFGRLTVISNASLENKKHKHYICNCDCGKEGVIIDGCKLRNGHTKSCGCYRLEKIKERSRKNYLVGRKFGQLTVIEEVKERKNAKIAYKCECDCEDKNIVIVTSCQLLSGKTTSCGCKNRKKIVVHRKHLLEEWDFEKNKDVDINTIILTSKDIVWWTCLRCKHEWQNSVNNRASNHNGCPKCNTSQGENAIAKILDKSNIKYETEVSIEGCKNINILRFDFYLPEYKLYVEFQGQQHYEPIKYFGGKRALIQSQKRDQIKRDFCRKNNIDLLEIPYWEFDNIEQIILEEIERLTGEK